MQAEPNWKEMYDWSKNKARGILLTRAKTLFANEPTRFVRSNRDRTVKSEYVNYWADEMASVAVCHLYEKWQQYQDRPDGEFRLIISTILHHALLRVLREQKASEGRSTSLDSSLDEDTMMEHEVRDKLESQSLDWRGSDSVIQEVDDTIDQESEWLDFNNRLTPTEAQILPEWVDNPSATSVEIAKWTGLRSGGAVRLHQMNIRKKAKSFIFTHPNKTGWQMHLVSEVTNQTDERRI